MLLVINLLKSNKNKSKNVDRLEILTYFFLEFFIFTKIKLRVNKKRYPKDKIK